MTMASEMSVIHTRIADAQNQMEWLYCADTNKLQTWELISGLRSVVSALADATTRLALLVAQSESET